MKTTIHLKTLKAVCLAASTEEHRFSLCGVLAECRADHVTYVATNGEALLCAREDLPELAPDDEARLEGDFIIPSEVIKRLKVTGKRSGYADIEDMESVGDKLALAGQLFKPIDSRFPDWRRICPAKPTLPPNTAIGHLSPTYMGLMGKFAEAMGKPVLSVTVHHTLCTDPHAITFGDLQALGVVMTYRTGAAPWAGLPAWAERGKP